MGCDEVFTIMTRSSGRMVQMYVKSVGIQLSFSGLTKLPKYDMFNVIHVNINITQ